jgi:ubiquinone biosynthesis protein UbiJ
LKAIEDELNRCIGESTAARELLTRLAGTSFAVHVEGLGLTIVLHSDGDRVHVGRDASDATAMLRATPFDLMKLLNADGVSGVRRTRSDLSGDLEVAER